MKRLYSLFTFICFVLFQNLAISQNNIAPLAVFSASPGCSTGPCSTFNDLNFGTCGTQQVWISGGNGTAPGQLVIQAEWSTNKTFDEFIIHHAQNNTRFLCGGLIQVWKGGNWVNHHTFSNLPLQCINSIVFPKVSTNRVRITSFVMCGSQLSNANFREIEIIEVPQIPNDARPYSFDKPGQAICNADKDVEISIENPGLLPLTSVKINWQVTRGGNSFPVNSYNWSGNIPPQGTSNSFNVGNFAPGFERGDIFKCWTEDPNGVPDSSADTDTLELLIREGISGTYNVGGIFNIDFATLGQVEHFVDSFGAVCDSLIFNFRDGVYDGQFTLNEVFSTSPARPVIFRGENGTNSNVVFVDSTISSGAFLNLNNSKNIYFENITFQNLSSTHRNVVQFNGSLENTQFINCTFENNAIGTTSTSDILVTTSGDFIGDGVVFEGCSFINGSSAISMHGVNEDSLIANFLVTNSQFINQESVSIDLSLMANVEIAHSNFYSTSTNVTNSVAVRVISNEGNTTVHDNNIASASGWPNNGVILEKCNGTPLNPGLIYNNMISVGGNSAINTIGLRTTNSAFLAIYYNSIASYGSSSASKAVHINGGGANKVVNNIFANFGGGLSLEYSETSGFPVFESNYNNLYSTSSTIAKHKTNIFGNISSWSNAIGDDANSISIDPNFISSTDLHVCSGLMNNAGKPIANVLMDVDGQYRNAVNPDIGADEYSPIGGLDLGNDTVVCKGTSLTLDGSLNSTDFYNAWSTGDSTALLIVSEPGIYSVVSENVCGFDSDTIVIGLSPSANLGSDTNICANNTIVLSANVSNANYQWSNGLTSDNIVIANPGIYSVTVVDANNCVTTDTIFITQSQAAELPSDTSFCGGQSIFLDPGTGPGTYTWSSGQSTPIILANTTGNYTVTYTDIFGCSSSASSNVIITNAPDASFTEVITGYAATFTPISYPNATYLWDFGDGDTSLQQTPTHLYLTPGRYVVTLQILNECGSDFFSKEIEAIISNTSEVSHENYFNIFPNPAKNMLNISIANTTSRTIEIIDIYGKTIKNVEQPNGLNNIVVDISDLSSGSYIIKMTTEEKVVQKPFIKQ